MLSLTLFPEVYRFSSGDRSLDCGDEGIPSAVAGVVAIDPVTHVGEINGECSARIGERETGDGPVG